MKDSAIIAELDSSAGDFAKKVYESLEKKCQRFDLVDVKSIWFSDGELKTKITKNIRRKRCYFIHDSAKKPNDWFVELEFVNETLHNSAADEIIDVLPYLRFCRQDRKDESRVSINAKSIAKNISKYAKRALTVDAHFPQIQGFFDIPFDNLYSFKTVTDYLKKNYPDLIENCTVLSPDAGGGDRAEAFAKRFGIEDIAIGYKTRSESGKIDKYKLLGDIKGKNVIIIDDIIDSGGTLVKAAEECKKQGALKIYAYAAHGLFTKGTDLKNFDKIFTSDTVYRGNDKNIEVISLIELFSEAIYRINEGYSISALFD